jgi:hypothetical protein
MKNKKEGDIRAGSAGNGLKSIPGLDVPEDQFFVFRRLAMENHGNALFLQI